MTDTLKAGSGLPAAEIERRIGAQKEYINTIKRVGAENQTPQHRIDAIVAKETAHLNELKESLNERLAASE